MADGNTQRVVSVDLPGSVLPGCPSHYIRDELPVMNFADVDPTSHAFNPASPSRLPHRVGRNDEQAFRAVARHSRLVRFLRYAIPAAVMAITSVILVAALLNPLRQVGAFPIDPGTAWVSGTKIIMELPRASGFTTDLRPYQLNARIAVQDVTKPDILEMKEIDARVVSKEGQHVTIRSIAGVYNTRSEVLKLNDHVVVNSTSGYEGHLSEATVDVATGNLVSDSPVQIRLPHDGLLTANRLKVESNGDLIVFGGGVEVTLSPDQVRPAVQD